MSTEGGNKAIMAALGANLGIAITKFIAFLLTQSSSMLAESIHSLADSGNQLLLLVGGKKSKKAATAEHPFGFGRERYVYAFIVSIVLFSVGGLFALYEAYHKWHEVQAGHGENMWDSRWWWVPVAVLVAALCMEGMSFRTAIRESNHTRGKASWVAFVRGAKAPELPVILLEDFAALIGLAFALVGVGLALLTHNMLWDAVGTAGIGILLVLVAITLAIEMKSLLVGEGATPEQTRKIRAAFENVDGVERLIHMKTLHMGPEELIVAAKIAVAPTEQASVVAEAVNEAESRARAAVPELTLLCYIEADIYSASAAAASPKALTGKEDSAEH